MDISIPYPPPPFNITALTLIKSAEDLVSHIEHYASHLVNSVTPQNATFENAIRPLAEIDNEVKSRVQYMALFQAVSSSSALRKASSATINLVDKAYLALFQNERLFALVDVVYTDIFQKSGDNEDGRLLAKFHRTFIDNGMGLTGNSRDRFIWISDRLIELRVAFMENLGSDPGCFWKTEDELAGVSLDRLDSMTQDGSKTQWRIPLKKPDVVSVLSHCRVAKTREVVFCQSQSIFPQNVEIFQETVILRDEAARLLGFRSFAEQKLRHQIVKSPSDVNKLLDELATYLQPLARQEIQFLQQMTEKESTPIHLWDLDFYHNRMLREKYHVDNDIIAEYFPAEVTIRRMLNVFETLFGLSIKEFDQKSEHDVWHPDVKAFSVWEVEGKVFIGYLYIDLYPREGKYNHAANFNIYPGYLRSDGQRALIATALVCNVSQPSKGPALLQHREVITIFHELGHGMHDLLGKSKYATFHGHRTVPDFFETPSQLLEFWCWVPKCLQRLSCHYSYVSPEYHKLWMDATLSKSVTLPPKEIPSALVDHLVAAKKVNQGILTLRQVAFSKFDMQIHSPLSHEHIRKMHIGELYNSLLQKMTFLQGPKGNLNWGNGHVTTSHYMWGQEANYYSYLYTRILAADIWFSYFQSDPMSQDAGLRYRKMILEPGGSQDEWKVLTEFLGREPKSQPYLQDIGAIFLDKLGKLGMTKFLE